MLVGRFIEMDLFSSNQKVQDSFNRILIPFDLREVNEVSESHHSHCVAMEIFLLLCNVSDTFLTAWQLWLIAFGNLKSDRPVIGHLKIVPHDKLVRVLDHFQILEARIITDVAKVIKSVKQLISDIFCLMLFMKDKICFVWELCAFNSETAITWIDVFKSKGAFVTMDQSKDQSVMTLAKRQFSSIVSLVVDDVLQPLQKVKLAYPCEVLVLT